MMDCETVREQLDDYLDHELSLAEIADFDRHLDACPTCQVRVARARRVLAGLRQIPVDEPDPELARRQFDQLWQDRDPAENRPRHPGGRFWAAAAAVVFALVLGAVSVDWSAKDASGQPRVVTLHADEQKEVRFAVRTDQALDNVRLTVRIPENMELDGFPGQRRVSWTTRLDEGVNMLRLPVRASGPGRATLNMEVSTQDGYHGEQALEMKVLRTKTSRKEDGRDQPEDGELI